MPFNIRENSWVPARLGINAAKPKEGLGDLIFTSSLTPRRLGKFPKFSLPSSWPRRLLEDLRSETEIKV